MEPYSIAYLGALVSSGKLEGTIFPSSKGWETAAIQLLVEEAGGKVTDIYGNAMQYGPEGQINGHIVSNGSVHDELLKIVQSCK
jgi:fructose-1,6-bisphosphatase/inositol monophosphatase family enzyme